MCVSCSFFWGGGEVDDELYEHESNVFTGGRLLCFSGVLLLFSWGDGVERAGWCGGVRFWGGCCVGVVRSGGENFKYLVNYILHEMLVI